MFKIDNLHASVADKPILTGVSLAFAAGEIHTIMVSDGALKSTLTHVPGGRANYCDMRGILG